MVDLLYEVIMNYPVEGVRRNYDAYKKSSVQRADDETLKEELGYSAAEIRKIKGGR